MLIGRRKALGDPAEDAAHHHDRLYDHSLTLLSQLEVHMTTVHNPPLAQFSLRLLVRHHPEDVAVRLATAAHVEDLVQTVVIVLVPGFLVELAEHGQSHDIVGHVMEVVGPWIRKRLLLPQHLSQDALIEHALRQPELEDLLVEGVVEDELRAIDEALLEPEGLVEPQLLLVRGRFDDDLAHGLRAHAHLGVRVASCRKGWVIQVQAAHLTPPSSAVTDAAIREAVAILHDLGASREGACWPNAFIAL